MRFLHTADWHLGRSLHGASLIEDQAHLLDQLVALAREQRPDAVLVAGDVYDRGVPPREAIELLDETLCRLVLEVGCAVVLIAGNHDSADRLAFGSRILRDRGLHILGHPGPDSAGLELADAHGPVRVYPVPYAEPAIVRHRFDQHDLQGHQAAMQCLLEGIWSRHPRGARALAVAHCFVAGGTASESERPLSVGGAGAVDPSVFEGFHYVALGHLHRPQRCGGNGHVRYSGSLMRYSFSEVDHDKAVLAVEMGPDGACSVTEVALSPLRQVRRVRGLLADLLAEAADGPGRDDYLMVTLDNREPVFDAMGKLREVYPNVLHVERPLMAGGSHSSAERLDHRRLGELELFEAFFRQVTDEELTAEQRAAFVRIAEGVRRQQQELDA